MGGGQDSAWLMSTIAQSAAALAAILGAFIVSRLVTLSSDRAQRYQDLLDLELRAAEYSPMQPDAEAPHPYRRRAAATRKAIRSIGSQLDLPFALVVFVYFLAVPVAFPVYAIGVEWDDDGWARYIATGGFAVGLVMLGIYFAVILSAFRRAGSELEASLDEAGYAMEE